MLCLSLFHFQVKYGGHPDSGTQAWSSETSSTNEKTKVVRCERAMTCPDNKSRSPFSMKKNVTIIDES
jgi:hypothetical protein